MLSSLHGSKTHYAGLHANADGTGYYLPAVPCSDGALGERLSARERTLETNTVTPLLQRMEKLGIVTRKKGEQDKRQQIVSLTEKGREMEEQAYKLIPAGMGETLKSCPLWMTTRIWPVN